MKWELGKKKLENSYFMITPLTQLASVCDQGISLVLLPPYGGTNEKKPLQKPEQLPALEQKRVYLIGQATIPCTPSLTPVDYGNAHGRLF